MEEAQVTGDEGCDPGRIIEPRSFRTRQLTENTFIGVSDAGDFAFLTAEEVAVLQNAPALLAKRRLAELKSKFFFLDPHAPGMQRLLASRLATRQETLLNGPSLHILVTTLRCAHSCQYCQVSRAREDEGFSMSIDTLEQSCDVIFESPSDALTVEFQGGDPLLRFDLIKHAIERIAHTNIVEQRRLRFVIASTLHQLTPEMCVFLKEYRVYLSTSIDGPEKLHNSNRATATRDAFSRTVEGIRTARALISPSVVSALLTVSRSALSIPEQIVDTYVELGLDEIFIRPLSRHGFARRNAKSLGYSIDEFHSFYARAFERVLYWNRKGVPLREVAASIALNKMLSPFDAGYVDLQSPTGAGLAVLVYNYDGYVYPSDEARMLAAAGDNSLRLGPIGAPLATLLNSDLQRQLISASLAEGVPGCRDCAYRSYCGPDPVSSYNECGSLCAPVQMTDHCQRQLWLFDFLFERLRQGDTWFDDLAFRWAEPPGVEEAASNA